MVKNPTASALMVASLHRQWQMCSAANPKGDEHCNRPKCKRCNRGRDYRRRVRQEAR